jgi:hypothetical protein
MTLWDWFTQNTLLIFALLFAFFIIAWKKYPTVTSWQAFLNSFESKGGQLILLAAMDMAMFAVLVHYWAGFSATLQNFMTGLISGVNGAFLGAIGARNTGGSGGNGTPPPKLDVTFVPGTDPAEKK